MLRRSLPPLRDFPLNSPRCDINICHLKLNPSAALDHRTMSSETSIRANLLAAFIYLIFGLILVIFAFLTFEGLSNLG